MVDNKQLCEKDQKYNMVWTAICQIVKKMMINCPVE